MGGVKQGSGQFPDIPKTYPLEPSLVSMPNVGMGLLGSKTPELLGPSLHITPKLTASKQANLAHSPKGPYSDSAIVNTDELILRATKTQEGVNCHDGAVELQGSKESSERVGRWKHRAQVLGISLPLSTAPISPKRKCASRVESLPQGGGGVKKSKRSSPLFDVLHKESAVAGSLPRRPS